MASLKAILLKVESTIEEWPKEAFLRVLSRFGRMPRLGWALSHSTFCDTFKSQISLVDYKRKAQNALTTKERKRCTVREINETGVKRYKSVSTVIETQSLNESKTFNEIKSTFLECKKELDELGIEEAQRIKKVPQQKINHLVLQGVIRAISEFATIKPITEMREIIKILQAAQITYDRITSKPRKISTWKTNIEAKIKK
ncbi:hypothetical protein BDAP_001133 [Binucleata daphniae]